MNFKFHVTFSWVFRSLATSAHPPQATALLTCLLSAMGSLVSRYASGSVSVAQSFSTLDSHLMCSRTASESLLCVCREPSESWLTGASQWRFALVSHCVCALLCWVSHQASTEMWRTTRTLKPRPPPLTSQSTPPAHKPTGAAPHAHIPSPAATADSTHSSAQVPQRRLLAVY